MSRFFYYSIFIFMLLFFSAVSLADTLILPKTTRTVENVSFVKGPNNHYMYIIVSCYLFYGHNVVLSDKKVITPNFELPEYIEIEYSGEDLKLIWVNNK